jgi:hypothetical protein
MIKKSEEELKLIFKYRDLLIKHDEREFGKFLRKNAAKFPTLPKEVLNYTDTELSEFMHYVKAQYPYLGAHFQNSRNYFRHQELEKGLRAEGYSNPALDEFIKTHDMNPPKCYQCKNFRIPIKEGEPACIHLMTDGRRPAMPEDLACTAWTPMPDVVKTS